jgi:Fe-S-cluster-containing hydrogenase components 1
MIACPYNARHFNLSKVSPQYEGKDFTPFEKARKNEHKTGTVGKCDLCKARVAAKQKPKCAETCPAKARIFGDLDDPKSEVAQLIAKHNAKPLKPEFGTKPSVYYLPI